MKILNKFLPTENIVFEAIKNTGLESELLECSTPPKRLKGRSYVLCIALKMFVASLSFVRCFVVFEVINRNVNTTTNTHILITLSWLAIHSTKLNLG